MTIPRITKHSPLHERLRAYRMAHGVSLRQTAKKIGWSAAYLSDLELDRRPFSPERVAKFREAVDALAYSSLQEV